MAKTYVRFEVPDEVKGEEFQEEYLRTAQDVLKEQTVLRLFEQGKVSAGYAARVLGMNRHDFLELLARHRVSVYNYPLADLDKEFGAVEKLTSRPSRKSKKRR